MPELSDVPRQTIWGDATLAALVWLFLLFVALLVFWFGVAAVVYGVYRAFQRPLQLVRWMWQ